MMGYSNQEFLKWLVSTRNDMIQSQYVTVTWPLAITIEKCQCDLPQIPRIPHFCSCSFFSFNLTLQAFHHRLRGRVKSVKRRSQSTRLPVSLEDDCRFYMLLSCSISIFCHLHRHILLQQIAISTDPTLRAAPAASLCFAFQPPVAPELLPAVSSPHARTLQECHLNSSMAMATLW